MTALIINKFLVRLNAYRTDHGNLETGVYRKPTHIDKYLAFDSHHPICHKMSVTKTLFMRAEYLPSSSDSKAFERIYIIDVLKPVHPSRKTTENDSSMMCFAVVPYIH